MSKTIMYLRNIHGILLDAMREDVRLKRAEGMRRISIEFDN